MPNKPSKSTRSNKTKKSKKTQADIVLSPKDAKVGGVTGGIAQHYGKDPGSIRFLAILFIILTGIIPGLIIYGVFYALMKRTSDGKKA